MKLLISHWLTSNQSNHLTIYRANIAYKSEAICGLYKESKIFIKFNIYSLYSTLIVLYSYVLASLM